MNRTILSYENVYKKYQLGETAFYAAKNVSFSIEMGDFAAIVGSSGSGSLHYFIWEPVSINLPKVLFVFLIRR